MSNSRQSEAHIVAFPNGRVDPVGEPLLLDRIGPAERQLSDELHASLSAGAAFIAPKFFYDSLGSTLFSAICELPEYYPTRTEQAIVHANRLAIGRSVGPGAVLIDLGAGDCRKAAALFDVLAPAQYVAVDVSVDFIHRAVIALQRENPRLPMIALGADFSASFELPAEVARRRRLMFYPGSSIGNFAPEAAARFLRGLRANLDDDGGLLIGVDLIKPQSILEPAYDDALGVTAAFNLNVLNHVNRLIGADFDVHQWRHLAFFDATHSRIEMHLSARQALEVSWPGGGRRFAAGERILTEYSYKYSCEQFTLLLAEAGFQVRAVWTDPNRWFALMHAGAGSAR